jgi:hypothetical protein
LRRDNRPRSEGQLGHPQKEDFVRLHANRQIGRY